MPDADDTLASALWLAAGGVVGCAVGRFVIAPWLEAEPRAVRAPSSTVQRPAVSATRALVAAPSGIMQPRVPYGVPVADVTVPPQAGPSGIMQPRVPYGVPVADVTVPPQAGPSGQMPPRVPYGAPVADVTVPPQAGPSGQAQPRDPYGDTTQSMVPVASQITSGPITMPSELLRPTSSTTSGPITSPTQSEPLQPDSASAMPSLASGPITSPSQTDTRLPESALVKPARRVGFATNPRVRRFDAVYERYRGELPIEYVRALVQRESDGEPAARTGSAIGLMQVVPVVLSDYNKRHGTAYRSEQLTDPVINVAIACELLRQIIASYRKHHPQIASLRADWTNLRFVELLTLGWNAGYSESGGVGRVVRYLERLGAREIDVDLVVAHAKVAGATKHLSNPAKLAWSKGVAALYQRERAAIARTPFASS